MKKILFVLLLAITSISIYAQNAFQFDAKYLVHIENESINVTYCDIRITFHADGKGFMISEENSTETVQYRYSEMIVDEVSRYEDVTTRLMRTKDDIIICFSLYPDTGDITVFNYFPQVDELFALFSNNMGLSAADMRYISAKMLETVRFLSSQKRI